MLGTRKMYFSVGEIKKAETTFGALYCNIFQLDGLALLQTLEKAARREFDYTKNRYRASDLCEKASMAWQAAINQLQNKTVVIPDQTITVLEVDKVISLSSEAAFHIYQEITDKSQVLKIKVDINLIEKYLRLESRAIALSCSMGKFSVLDSTKRNFETMSKILQAQIGDIATGELFAKIALESTQLNYSDASTMLLYEFAQRHLKTAYYADNPSDKIVCLYHHVVKGLWCGWQAIKEEVMLVGDEQEQVDCQALNGLWYGLQSIRKKVITSEDQKQNEQDRKECLEKEKTLGAELEIMSQREMFLHARGYFIPELNYAGESAQTSKPNSAVRLRKKFE